MSPPQLPRNAPITDIPHPLEVSIRPVRRNELRTPLLNSRDRGLGQRFDLHKPLRGQQWFDNGVTALAMSDIVFQRFRAHQQTLRVEIFQHTLARLGAIETVIWSSVRGDFC